MNIFQLLVHKNISVFYLFFRVSNLRPENCEYIKHLSLIITSMVTFGYAKSEFSIAIPERIARDLDIM